MPKTISIRDRVDVQYGMSLKDQTVNKRTSFMVEIWSHETCEDVATTGWHAKKEDAFDEAYRIAMRYLK